MIRYLIHRRHSILSAAFLLSLCGCIPEFREPLSNGETSEVDEQLLGPWYVTGEPSVLSLTIVKVAGTKALELQYPRGKGQTDAEKPERLFTTKIGETRFVSIANKSIPEKDGQKQPETFSVFTYKIEGKTLQLFMLKDDVFGDAVIAAKLQGAVKGPAGLFGCLGPKYESVTVTDSPKKLREFLAASKKELIDREPVMTCTREVSSKAQAKIR